MELFTLSQITFNPAPSAPSIFRVEQGYTKMLLSFASSGLTDPDLIGTAIWRRLPSEALSTGVLQTFLTPGAPCLITGLTPVTTYEITSAHYDLFVSEAGTALLNAFYTDPGSPLLSSVVETHSTISPAVIEYHENIPAGIVGGIFGPVIHFWISGKASRMKVEGRLTSGTTWAQFYYGESTNFIEVAFPPGEYEVRYSSEFVFSNGDIDTSSVVVYPTLVTVDDGSQAFEDLSNELRADFEVIAQDALDSLDLPTTVEVQALIDDSIALVNDADTEDFRIDLVNSILSVTDQLENEASVRRLDLAITSEKEVRAAAILELKATDQATLSQIALVSSDLAGTNLALSGLTAQVTDPTTGLAASFSLAQEAKTTADGAVTSTSSLTNIVNNPTTGLSATFTLAGDAKATADGALSSATAITNIVNNPTTGLAATFTLAGQAKTTADGAATSATAVTNKVNNPTNGLAATFTLAGQAKSTADGAVSANATLSAQVNNATNGLAATFTLAGQAKSTADGAVSANATLSAQVNNPTNGLSATFTLAGQAKTTADGAVTSIAGLQTQVSNIDGELTSAQLLLGSTVNELGVISSRAFLGVSSNEGGSSIVSGVTIDGTTRTMEFRADTFRLSNTAGALQMYWDSTRQKWIFNGDLVSANFQTGTSGYRAEMGSKDTFPFWYGTGSKNTTNGLFYVDTLGNVTVKNASVLGSLVTGTGSSARVEVGDDGTYLLWAGNNAKTDINGTFWIKKDGTGFIKGEFFSGQIVESKFGTASSVSGAVLTATAANHSSSGFPCEVVVSSYVSAKATGNLTNKTFIVRLVAKRNGTIIGTYDTILPGAYESVEGETYWHGNSSATIIDTSGSVELRNYTVEVSMVGTASFFSLVKRNATIKTFENKLPT